MRHTTRLLTLLALLLALCGLFVFYGAAEPAPEHNDYPGEDELATDYDQYIDQQVELGGIVVDTDPVIIGVEHDAGTDQYTIENAPDVSEGQELRLFATVQPDNTLEAHDGTHTTIVRDTWEQTYMYAISIVAALWVATRAFTHWRVDTDEWGFVPRGGEHDG